MQRDAKGPSDPQARGGAANHSSSSLHPLFDRASVRSNNSPQISTNSNFNGSSGQAAQQHSRRRVEAERAALRQRMRKDIQRQQQELRRQKEFQEKTKIWEEQILPNWEQVQHTNKVRDLCLKGIPPTIRTKVWPLLLGNDLEIDEVLFDGLNQEVQERLGHRMTAHKGKVASSYTSGQSFDETPTSPSIAPMASRRASHPERSRSTRQSVSVDHTADIPIPRSGGGGGGEDDSVDITDMPWFENERTGCLDASDFSLVQRQLLDRPNYLLQRVLKSPREADDKPSDLSAESLSPPVRYQLAAPSRDPNLSAPFALDPDEASAASSPALSTPARAPATPATPATVPRPSLVGLASPGPLSELTDAPPTGGLYTPPRRVKHDSDYLIHAGLLVERESESALMSAHDPLALDHLAVTESDLSRELRLSRECAEVEGGIVSAVPVALDVVPEEQEEETVAPELAKLFAAGSLVEWDLPRTFPTLAFFHDGGPMHTGMERILLCYALFDPKIGYVQGMSFLVATLLLCMDEFEAFKCLANLLSRRMSRDFYCLQKESIDAYARCFDHYFRKLLPLLFNHLRAEGVSSEMFLMDWILSLFTKALPLEIAAQVWDGYLCEGESYILAVGLGLLKMFAATLSTFTFERITPFLLHLPEDIKAEDLFNNIAQINISKKHYEKTRKKMMGGAEGEAADDSPSHTLLTKSLRILKLTKPVPEPLPGDVVADVAAMPSPGMRRSRSAQSLAPSDTSKRPLARSSFSTQSRRSESTDGVSRLAGESGQDHVAVLQALVEANTLANASSAKLPPPLGVARPSTGGDRGSTGSTGSGGSAKLAGMGMDPGLLSVAGPSAGLAAMTRERLTHDSVRQSSSDKAAPSSRTRTDDEPQRASHASRRGSASKAKDCVLC